MNPKKTHNLYKTLSEELSISEYLIEDLVEFMYKNLRQKLSNLVHPRINVDGLGQFVCKAYNVRRGISEAERKLKSHDTSTFNAYFNKKKLESKIELLKELDIIILKEEEKKNNFKTIKNEYISKHLETPERNNGGD
jgi:nucleoid DNA-binding protein